MKLYDYFRSSASYRVRIALNFKNLTYSKHEIHLVNNNGEQHSDFYKNINPQCLIPSFIDDSDQATIEQPLSQSLAIIEYLEEKYPKPSIMPQNSFERAFVRKLAYMIACDIHPLNNLRVLKYLSSELNITDEQRTAWYQHWLKLGLDSYEASISSSYQKGNYSFGKNFTLADICLVPQVYNALRYQLPMDKYKNIVTIYHKCLELPAVAAASPQE